MKNLAFQASSVNLSWLFPLFLLQVFVGMGIADDWPRFRGPGGTGISAETGLKSDGKLETAWKAKLGLGYSAPVIGGGKVIVPGHNGSDTDTLFCFDETEGNEIWKFSYPQPLGDRYFPGGTTGTATIDGDRVYYGAREGELFCLNAEDGKVMWQVHLVKDFEYTKPEWGFTGAPLVLGDRLYINAGAAGMALNKSDGSVVWKSKNDVAGYSTPEPLTHEGKDYLIFSTKRSYVCVEPETGKEVWSERWMTRYGVNAANPVVSGDTILIASGYGKGAVLLKWEGKEAPVSVWKSRDLKSQMNAAILVDEYLYGIDGDEGKDGTALKCMKMIDGETLWSEASIGHGAITIADGKLFVLTDSGDLQIAPVSTDVYKPTLKQKVLNGRVWTVPVIANGRLYCRDETGEFVVLSLK